MGHWRPRFGGGGRVTAWMEVGAGSWVTMRSQATGLCLLIAIALSSPMEQGIILGSVVNMEEQPWTSQGRGDDARWLLEERRC